MITLTQTQMLLKLTTVNDVYKSVQKAYKFEEPVDVKQGLYTVDGKSILGIFSLNLLEPVLVTFLTHNSHMMTEFYHEMEEFEVDYNPTKG